MTPLNGNTDRQLLASLKDGERFALDLLYRRFKKQLYEMAYKKLHIHEAAEDIVQNIFLNLWLKRADIHTDNFEKYLFTTLHWRVMDHLTRKKPPHFYDPLHLMLEASERPDISFAAKELYELILAFADTFPKKRRAVFLLYFRDKLTVEEIADKLGTSKHTVRNQLAKSASDIRSEITPFLIAMIFSNLYNS